MADYPLGGEHLEEAQLGGAHLEGAILIGAEGLTSEQLRAADPERAYLSDQQKAWLRPAPAAEAPPAAGSDPGPEGSGGPILTSDRGSLSAARMAARRSVRDGPLGLVGPDRARGPHLSGA